MIGARSTPRLRRAAAIAVVVAATSFPGRAVAVCDERPLDLVWSAPADGARDVALVTELRFLTLGDAPGDVLVNGAPYERRRADGAWIGARLTPDTNYDVELQFYGRDDVLTLSFRTGDRPLGPPPPAPRVVGLVDAATLDRDASCRRALDAQGCFDQGQSNFLNIVVEGEAVAWRVEVTEDDGDFVGGALWPARCGAPILFTQAFREDPWCARAAAVNADGQSSPWSELHCPGAASSCAASGTTPAAAVVLVLLRRRPRRRR